MNKLLDFGFDSIDLWRSEEMQLMQVGGWVGLVICVKAVGMHISVLV